MKYLYIILIALIGFTAYSCVYPDDDQILAAYDGQHVDNDTNEDDDSDEPIDDSKDDDSDDKQDTDDDSDDSKDDDSDDKQDNDNDSDEQEEKETYTTVDLGLPSGTKWCVCNVDAKSAEEYGSYYTWSDAKSKIPNGYAMPNYNQARELVNQCSWTWTSINGIYGYKGTGPNKKTIFLSAGGLYKQYSYGMDINWLGEGGAYWVDYDNTSEYSTHPSASAILFLHEDIVPIAPKMSGEAQSSKLALRCVKK